ncbi:MAG: SulP family sulfate permease [Saprospiraceae bacterium]|jgi:SulP family sulfate permease
MQKIIAPYKDSFKADITGGLLAAIIGLPMGLAFGIQSGLGAAAGIYTAIILAIIAFIFGGTKTLITDPTGPMTVVAATVVSSSLAAAGDLATAMPLIVATFVLAGVFELLFGVLNLGKYVKFLPYPVLSGFMAGIGVIIISVQIFPLMGQVSPRGFTNIITGLGEGIGHLNQQALFLGALTIAIVYLLPLLTKKIPSILAALIIGTLVSVGFGMNVPVIGFIPTTLPSMQLGLLGQLNWSDLSIIIPPAIMIGGLGVIDTLLTSVVADNLTKTKHDSRRTVIGQGIGNIIVGLFGGIPGAGATMGTVTNIKAGARTKLSGLMKGVFLLLIIMSVAQYVAYVPMPVLAGLLITIGIGIIDYKGIKMLFKIPKQDAIVWAIVLLVTLFDNLLNAVAVGFLLSAILFIGRLSKSMMDSQQVDGLKDLNLSPAISDALVKKVHVQHISGPLFFGCASSFHHQCEAINNVFAAILRMEDMPFLDQSGLVTLEAVIEDWQDKGMAVYLTGANEVILKSMKQTNIIPKLISKEHCFRNAEDCLLAALVAINQGKHLGNNQKREQVKQRVSERYVPTFSEVAISTFSEN